MKKFLKMTMCSLVLLQMGQGYIVLANEDSQSESEQTEIKPTDQADAIKQAVRQSLFDAFNKDYLDKLQIPDNAFMAGVSNDISNKNKEILHQDLHKLGEGDIKPETNEEEEMVKYFNLARNFEKRNQEGYEPAKPYLERIEGLKSLTDFKAELKDWIHSGIDLPFMLTAGGSLERPETNQLRLIAPQTILPDTSFYDEGNEYGQALLNTYRDSATQILTKMGYSQEDAAAKVEQALAFDKQIATHSTPSDQRRSLVDQLKEADPII